MIKFLYFYAVLFSIPLSISVMGQDLDAVFTTEEAIGRLDQIREALVHFRDFTQTVFEKSDMDTKYDIYVLYENGIPDDAEITVGMTGEDFQRDGYLNWDMQHIGFPNWTKYIQGYIEYLELRNKKLTHELAILENRPAGTIDSLKTVILEEEERLFDTFLNEDAWVD